MTNDDIGYGAGNVSKAENQMLKETRQMD